MRKFLLFSIVFMVCIGLTGCATWAGNRAIYAKSDNATIFGGWGYAHMGKGTSLLIWDNSVVSQAKSEKEFIGFLPVPQIQVDPNSNLNIGKPSKYPPSAVVAESQSPSLIEQAASAATGNIPLPK